MLKYVNRVSRKINGDPIIDPCVAVVFENNKIAHKRLGGPHAAIRHSTDEYADAVAMISKGRPILAAGISRYRVWDTNDESSAAHEYDMYIENGAGDAYIIHLPLEWKGGRIHMASWISTQESRVCINSITGKKIVPRRPPRP